MPEIQTAEQKLLAAADRVRRALDAEPAADADADAELASDLLALAAREVVREVERAHPDQRPAGWDDGLLDGTPVPDWRGARTYTCGRCHEEFSTNFDRREIQCPECDARLCASCGRWEEVQV